jgi:chromosome segregation ATPase
MSFFRRNTPSDVDRVKSEITRLNVVLNQHERRTDETTGAATELRDQTAELRDQTAELATRLDAIAGQLSALDARITAVGTELANQLNEFGNEIDAIRQRPLDALPDGALDDLRSAQTRLASEQARYQIAFREDLARVAEQVRRPR